MNDISLEGALDAQAAGIPSPEPLTSLFLRRARRNPDVVVAYSKVEGRWTGMTWRESLQATEEVALGLLELGAERGHAIGVVSNTRREWSQADMAILLIGGITIGVYPTLTADQTRYILEHAGVRIVFVEDAALRQKILEATASWEKPIEIVTFEREPSIEGAGLITLDGLRRLGAKRRREHPDEIERRAHDNKSSDVATYVYTSGTTGEPKGAMLTHANFHYVIHATAQLVPYEGEVALAFLPLAHSLQRYANYLGLIEDVHGYYAESLEAVPQNIQEVRPTVFAAVPRVLEKVHAKIVAKGREAGGWKTDLFNRSLDALRVAGEARRSGLEPGLSARVKARIGDVFVGEKVRDRLGGRVKFLGCGGAPLNPEVHRFFEDIGIPILEGWGLTETSAPACVNTLTNRRIGTVGRPIPGTEVKIAADGEILVRGPGVFVGYYRNEAATKDTFDDEAWFKTGDIGVMSRDGFLTITDRKKDLIITAGGKNIAPQPIEAALKRDVMIAQAVVIGDKRPYLVALLVLDAEARAKLAQENGLPADAGAEEIAAAPAVKARIGRHVEEVNAALPRFEQIKRWDILPSEMTIDSGELTPTLKVKRRIVHERHSERIERLYASGAAE